MTAYIGYNNILDGSAAVITAGEATGKAKENAYDWKPFTFWQVDAAAGTIYYTIDYGSAVEVDSWGMAFHDLADNAGSITPQYSAGSTSPFSWSNLDSQLTPTDDSVVFRKVTAVTVRYYRFKIDCASSPLAAFNFGNLFLGKALALPEGIKAPFKGPRYGRKRRIINNVGENGNFLGRSLLSQGKQFDIGQTFVAKAWIDSNFEALADHVELKPFYFVWDQENRPTEAVYAWANGISYPSYVDSLYQEFSLQCVGVDS